nr:MAG TPA: hypothetical protein [Caudoviricetes sp.]
MKMDNYALAKKICLEMGIEWDDNAKYATIGKVELKEYLKENMIFINVIEEKYHPVELSTSVYKRTKENEYVLAA